MSVKKLFRSWKIWLLIACLIMAIVAIRPIPWADGVAVRSVIKDSAASLAGFQNPKPTVTPMGREVIHSINNVPIKNIDDYTNIISQFKINTTIVIKTNKDIYRVTLKPQYNITILNETENVSYVEQTYDNATNTTTNVTKSRIQNKTLQ